MSRILCPKCGQPHPRCASHKKSTGNPCMQRPRAGGKVCRYHGGAARQVRAKADQRAQEQAAQRAVTTLGLPVDITPTEALLQEVQWTAGHVQWLRGKVAELDEQALVWGTTRVETEGGTSLVINVKAGSVSDVETAPGVKSIETAAPSIWYVLYTKEREHLVTVCAAALKAGVEERRVRLAESQGDLVADAIRRILNALNLTPAQEALVSTVVPAQLRLIAGGTP